MTSVVSVPHRSSGTSYGSSKNETVFAIVKPHAVQEGEASNIKDIIAAKGFTIQLASYMRITQSQVVALYKDKEKIEGFLDLVASITSGPVLALGMQKTNGIADFQALMGNPDPKLAEEGTLRKRFGVSVWDNAIDAPVTADSIYSWIFQFTKWEHAPAPKTPKKRWT